MNVVHVICKLFNVDAMYYTHALSYYGKKTRKYHWRILLCFCFTNFYINCHLSPIPGESCFSPKKIFRVTKKESVKRPRICSEWLLPFHASFVVFYLWIGTFRVFFEHCQIFKTRLNELVNFWLQNLHGLEVNKNLTEAIAEKKLIIS